MILLSSRTENLGKCNEIFFFEIRKNICFCLKSSITNLSDVKFLCGFEPVKCNGQRMKWKFLLNQVEILTHRYLIKGTS